MTLAAIARELTVQSIGGRHMAGLAAIPHAGAKKRMSERFATELIEVRSLVIVVTRRAVQFDQFLMERGPCARLGNRNALGRANSNVLQHMARDPSVTMMMRQRPAGSLPLRA